MTNGTIPADITCSFEVKDGKVFCITHGHSDHLRTFQDWEDHEDHKHIKILPFRHIIYTAELCDCGTVLLDEEV